METDDTCTPHKRKISEYLSYSGTVDKVQKQGLVASRTKPRTESKP